MGLEGELARLAADLGAFRQEHAGLPAKVTTLETQYLNGTGPLAKRIEDIDRRLAAIEAWREKFEDERETEREVTAKAIEKAGERKWGWVQMIVNALLAAASALALYKLGVKP